MKARVGLLIAGMLLSLFAVPASAETFPARAVTWVVPFPPAGFADSSVRVIAKALSEKLGKPVIVDNRPGAAGIVGMEAVANAKPDGYTIVYASSGPIATYPYLYKKLAYDPIKSFAPVHSMVDSPMVMVASATAPFKTLAEMISYAKKNPKKINFGSAGSGSSTHLAGELLMQQAGIEMTHVPYKGSSPLMADLIAGVVDVAFDFAIVVKPQIEAGKLFPIATTGHERLKALPNVATLKELGYASATFVPWTSIATTAGSPPDVVQGMANAFAEALKEPSVIKFFEDNGTSIMRAMATDELKAFYLSEQKMFKQLVESSGASVE